MTATFQVHADSPQAIKFIEYMRTLPFVEEKKAKKVSNGSDLRPMTMDEFHRRIARSEEDFAAGRVVSNEDMGRWINSL